MSKARTSILAALATIAVGLGGASSASAVPANGTVISQIASIGTTQKVQYYYRPYYRPYYYRPYYRPYYYRPYYRPYYYYPPYYSGYCDGYLRCW